MKKVKQASDDIRKEYRRSDFSKLERGRYYKRVTASSNVVIIDPEVNSVFPNSSAVNNALHSLVDVAERAAGANQRVANRTKHRRALK